MDTEEQKRIKHNQRAKRWFEKNKDQARAASRRWKENNREYVKECLKIWRENNQDKIRKQQREYSLNRRARDPMFRIRLILRSRIHKYLTGKSKVGSFVSCLGCDSDFLKKHLEDGFYDHPKTGIAMTWDNYGKLWHVDHIVPLCAFDLTNAASLNKASHYSNLRPLWREDNLAKMIDDKKRSIKKQGKQWIV